VDFIWANANQRYILNLVDFCNLPN